MQLEYIEPGSIASLSTIAQSLSLANVVVVSGRESYWASDAEKKVSHGLHACQLRRFYDFATNTKLEDVYRGIEFCQQADFDGIVAIGGGSVIDMAKMINCFYSNDVDPRSYILGNKEPFKKKVPLIAIPTTAGSGSEATQFAVVYLDKVKHSVDDPAILPNIAIIDSTLTDSLPPRETAVTGMDAFCQAIESYWSIHSTPQSKSLSEEALRIIPSQLPRAVNKPDNESRKQMAKAAHLAGKAINITKTTLSHATAYPMTTYLGIPHGHAVALSLPSVCQYIDGISSDDNLDPRGADYVRANLIQLCHCLAVPSPAELQTMIYELMDSIGLEISFKQLGHNSAKAVQTILDAGINLERAKNTPRVVTEESLKSILNNIPTCRCPSRIVHPVNHEGESC